ncbi:M48 family metallopeptidase [Clostridium sp. SHJSY1]|uniref:M48 family metallopeptidase n=1 Tax=Clostridium sp. SHJSY1 TaxID=2942483 RepID=UPI0028756DE2|nr:SprT family zinc-dependent metalloprotease [Clostridium sp. SHJSY1]MDS0526481.1 M48 family metallopeptidase [Clostridium sp. SHJSY1]
MSNIIYKVYRTKRKSSLISIDENGEITIKVPIGTSDKQIEELVQRKNEWIKSKLILVNSRKKLNSDEIMYLGQIYKVKVMLQPNIKKESVDFNEKIFYVNACESERAEKVLEKKFREDCKEIILKKIEIYQQYFEKSPKEIKVKEQKARWGSCTYDNRIFFNWKLIMGRESALEYVVVHEMCHMVHKNHSKEYWSLVKKIMPHYEEEHLWLKNNGYLMKL